jgi:hypothetical protein
LAIPLCIIPDVDNTSQFVLDYAVIAWREPDGCTAESDEKQAVIEEHEIGSVRIKGESVMKKQTRSIDQLLERISVNSKVMVGKPVIRGTRIPG